jgi:spermidine/putrescine transport system substrate-binding protein
MFGSARASRRSLLAGLGAGALGVSLGGVAGCSNSEPVGPNGEARRLNFYNWDTYTGRTTLADFARETGVQVKMSLFATNDELFSKLRAGNPGYDIIVPTNDFVSRLMLADLLMPLDLEKVPNRANLTPGFLNPPFDPGRRFSMPYTWLVLGIGYRKSKVAGTPDSWKWLLESDRYAGRIGVMSEAQRIIALGAKYLGRPLASLSDQDVSDVADLYIRQKPNIRIFHHDEGQELLLAGDIDLVMEYNGDIAQVMAEDPDLGFVVPREGSLMSSDCLCIPKGAPRPDNAHRFINFILDARNGAAISDTIRYPTPNAAALALMPPDYRDNPAIFPPTDAMARCEYVRFESLERVQLYDETLTKIFAS